MNRACNSRVGERSLSVAKIFGAIGLAMAVLGGTAQAATRLVPQDALKGVGLTRAWFGQVHLDRARHRLHGAMLQGDRLTVLTSAGVVQDFNALTGAVY